MDYERDVLFRKPLVYFYKTHLSYFNSQTLEQPFVLKRLSIFPASGDLHKNGAISLRSYVFYRDYERDVLLLKVCMKLLIRPICLTLWSNIRTTFWLEALIHFSGIRSST